MCGGVTWTYKNTGRASRSSCHSSRERRSVSSKLACEKSSTWYDSNPRCKPDLLDNTGVCIHATVRYPDSRKRSARVGTSRGKDRSRARKACCSCGNDVNRLATDGNVHALCEYATSKRAPRAANASKWGVVERSCP